MLYTGLGRCQLLQILSPSFTQIHKLHILASKVIWNCWLFLVQLFLYCYVLSLWFILYPFLLYLLLQRTYTSGTLPCLFCWEVYKDFDASSSAFFILIQICWEWPEIRTSLVLHTYRLPAVGMLWSQGVTSGSTIWRSAYCWNRKDVLYKFS